MSILNGKKVLLGISGGIAAYKSANLVRLIIKSGAEVQVIMTPSSKSFITPLTLSTLSKNEVYSEFFDEEKENKMWNNHVEMAMWADYFIIAPATSNTISKMASARANNLLGSVFICILPSFAIGDGMATPRLLLFFVRFEDSVDGFANVLQDVLRKT